jgi:hypothetical protein
MRRRPTYETTTDAILETAGDWFVWTTICSIVNVVIAGLLGLDD